MRLGQFHIRMRSISILRSSSIMLYFPLSLVPRLWYTCALTASPILHCPPASRRAHGESAMNFEEILDQAIAMLQRRGRVTYRTLKRQFQLDDDALEDLK